MKKLFPYLFVLFVACTACSSDDTAIPSYTKITEEQKKLLLGNWQLTHYSNPQDGHEVDFIKTGVLINVSFIPEGQLNIYNPYNKMTQFTDNSLYLTKHGSLTYTFEYIKQWDNKDNKREKLYIKSDFYSKDYNLVVTDDELTLSTEEGEVFSYKRVLGGTMYPTISDEDKMLLVGEWKLSSIQSFNGRSRDFMEKEEVLYRFTMGNELFIYNKSAEKHNDYYDRYIQSSIIHYNFQFDFIWDKREILALEDLGQYSAFISLDVLILSQFDGDVITFTRVN